MHWLRKSECQVTNKCNQTLKVMTYLQILTPVARSLRHFACMLNVLIFPIKHSYLSQKLIIEHTPDIVSGELYNRLFILDG
jgi:hypothetical protein